MKYVIENKNRLVFASAIVFVALFCNKEPVGVTDVPGSFFLMDTLISINDTVELDAGHAFQFLQGGTVTYSWSIDSQAYTSDTNPATIRFSSSEPGRYKATVAVYESNKIAAYGTAIITVKSNDIPVAVVRLSDTTVLYDGTIYIQQSICISTTIYSTDTLFVHDITSDTITIEKIVHDTNEIHDTVKLTEIAYVHDTLLLDATLSFGAVDSLLEFEWTGDTSVLIKQGDSIVLFSATEPKLYSIRLRVYNGKEWSESTYVNIKVVPSPRGNLKPEITSNDSIIYVNDTLSLACSTPVNGDFNGAIHYNWFSNSPAANIIGSGKSAVRFTSNSANNYTVFVYAYSGQDTSEVSTTRITVIDFCTAIARVGPDRTMQVYDTLRLDAGKSYSDRNAPLTYKWVMLDGGWLSNDSLKNPLFTAMVADTFRIVLTVNDGFRNGQPDTLTLFVYDRPVKKIVKAIATGDTIIAVGDTARLDGIQSIEESEATVTCKWRCLSGETVIDSLSPQAGFVSQNAGSYVLSLIVYDTEDSLNSAQTFMIVNVLLYKPTADAGENDSLLLGDSIQLDGSNSSDDNGDTLTYKWQVPYGGYLSSDTVENPWFTADNAGDYYVGLRVFNGKDSSENIDWIKIRVKDTVFIPAYRPTAVITGNDTGYLIFDIDSVHLDGSMSKYAPGTTPVFSWTASGNNPEPVLLDSVAKPAFKIATPGVYTFFLHLFDGYYYSEAAQRTITVFKPKLYVSKTSSWAYQTIEEALEMAEAGDTILVGTGRYNENLTIMQSGITILGMDRENCIVDSLADASLNGSIFTLDYANSITIKHLTIVHGSPNDSCAGIRLINCANIVIEENDLVFNNTDGIRAFNSGTVHILKNRIASNSYNGIRAINSTLTISENTFVDNGLNLGAETADIALEGDNGVRHKIQILNNNITGINSSVNKKDQIKVLSPLDIVVGGNTIKSIDRYSIYCVPGSHTWLTVSNNRFTNKNTTSLFCFEADSLLISNNRFVLEDARESFQKGMDLVGCFKGTIESDTVENFWTGIQTDNTPPGGYSDSLVIKFNSFLNDSIGIFAKGEKAPDVYSNIFVGCDTTFVDSTN